MNILLMDGLPFDIDGVPISPDFRNMIQFDVALHAEKMEDAVLYGLNLLFPGFAGELDENGDPYPGPADLEKAMKDLMWFYRREKEDRPGEKKATGRAYDFEGDDGMISAAFLEAYGITLTDGEFMHWWEFMNLLEGLPESTRMAKAMYYRTVDTSGMRPEEKKHILEMRRIFAIEQAEAEPLTAEEMGQRTKDRIRRRMEEARRSKKGV